jgi:hypothetical protein
VIVMNNFFEALPDHVRAEQAVLVGTEERKYVAIGATESVANGTVSGPQPDCGTAYSVAVGGWLLTSGVPARAPKVAADGNLRATFSGNEPGDNFTELYQWDLAPLRE